MDRPLLRSAAGSIVIGNPVTGGGANRVLFEDASQNLATNSGFTFASNVLTAPTITATTAFVGPQISAGSTGGVMSFTDTAGEGPLIAAGVAASNARRALKISQTWTDGTSSNIGIVGNFDMGATGTATGKLLSLQAGSAGTSEVASIDQAGNYFTQGNYAGGYWFTATKTAGFGHNAGGDNPFVSSSSTVIMSWTSGDVRVKSTLALGWSSGAPDSTGLDTALSRVAAGIIGFGTGAAGNGAAALFLSERAAPSAPAANGVYIYAQDNGAGKTQLMALFASGAAQQIAIEP